MPARSLMEDTLLDHKFKKILNFRDVGFTVNKLQSAQSAAGLTLKSGLLFRSARPDSATSSDRSLLLDVYKIKTIIDLRSKTEHINASKKHSDAVGIAQSASVPASNSAVSKPLKITGIRYAEINLNGKGFERALLWKLRWSSIAKLASYMVLGYRTEGIAVLGREVMQPRGLIGLGMDTLDFSGHEIKEAFDVLADERSYPILVHCTQGKDRTGILILLVLLLCQVDLLAIEADYLRSEEELQPEMKERLKEIKSIGLDESFAGCPQDFVEKVAQHINEKYGGVEAYLTKIGVGPEAQESIKSLMIEQYLK